MAWGDTVLSALPQRPRSRFRFGRFVAASAETASFALPDAFHLERCREVQREVEEALSAHFGRPVRLDLIVVADAPPATPGRLARPERAEPPADDEEPVDWSELTDAPPGAVPSPIEHVLQAFEGAEVVEE